MEGLWELLLKVLLIWLILGITLIMLPAMFGFSLGITELYMKILVKTLEWATRKIQKKAQEQPGHPYSPSTEIIEKRDKVSLEDEMMELRRYSNRNRPLHEGDFDLSDVIYFSKKGFEAIVEDEVTTRFSSEELVLWNLLTRTNRNFQHISVCLTILWGLGVGIRYGVLLPLRVKVWLSELVHLMCYRICARGLSATIRYHNKENRPKKGGICVANHTSPIDVVILANDGGYAMVGQVHGGLMGIIQRSMVKACPHVWFERSEMKDRHLVIKRLSDHVADKTKLPILIFPEGTCINNTSVMMFKKGSFEIGGTIYPVAIKYDPQFGDAFWNSSKYGMVSYLLQMMTSWAIVCNVWYLPPMTRQEGEDAVQFANRVKAAIAQQGGLVDLAWDGALKRAKVKDNMKEQQQKCYSKMIFGEESS
ncbi:glycerol-3-phosphate acyltransferase 3 isoform X2 [Carcharodon carcharias]|uniref:glycerol-3-phosphate acyltransferase 3 isoform X2 n=1 Tax=Carcharodon carcharias TaxID=13397 RepID=UPI001B7DDE67|nr:glycerol-3-phosphate acyltransferase 3 isoform X2 [Carcharodon carcharias]